MAFGTGRFAGGGNKNKFGLDQLFLRRGRRLRGIIPRRGVSSCLLLRVRGLLEGGIVGSNLVSITITLDHRSLLGGRSEAGIEVNGRSQLKMKSYKKEV
jgi:hypothetical protein